jgi:hypothetical protein
MGVGWKEMTGVYGEVLVVVLRLAFSPMLVIVG